MDINYALVLLPVLILDTSLVSLNPFNGDDFLLGGKESRCGGRVGEIEPTQLWLWFNWYPLLLHWGVVKFQ